MTDHHHATDESFDNEEQDHFVQSLQPQSNDNHHTSEIVNEPHLFSLILRSSKQGLSFLIGLKDSQILSHLLLVTNLVTYIGFIVLIPKTMKIINPFMFSFLRYLILLSALFLMMIIVDQKFVFRSERFMQKRSHKFLNAMNCNGCNFIHNSIVYYIIYENRITRAIIMRLPRGKQAKRLAMCGLMVIVNQVLFSLGFYLTNATVSGVLQPLVAIMVCVMSMMFGREGKSIIKLIGVVISVIGAISMLVTSALFKQKSSVTFFSETEATGLPFNYLEHLFGKHLPATNTFAFIMGMAFLIGNTFCFSCYLLLQKKLLNQGVPSMTVTFWSFLFGSIVILVVTGFTIPSFSFRKLDWFVFGGLAYAAIPCGAVSFYFATKAASLTTPTVVGIYSTISPLASIGTGVLILGESTSPYVLIGAGLILVGVILVILARYRESKQNTKEEKMDEIEMSEGFEHVGNTVFSEDGASQYSTSINSIASTEAILVNPVVMNGLKEEFDPFTHNDEESNVGNHEEDDDFILR